MNTFDLACAVLSSSAYRTGFDPKNRIAPLTDAIRLPGALGYKTIGGLSGFEASAFEYGGKIVIAYAGTNTDQKVDLAADGALALGITHPQLLQAAEFYEAIKNNPAYAGKEVVFTGHSLGGGLAAAMGVFFNKQAVTFDPAPFRLAATQATADQIKAFLASTHPEWPTDSDLASYATVESRVGLHAPTLSAIIAGLLSPVSPALARTVPNLPFPITIRGEANIKTYSVSGEFLTNGYQGFASSDLNTLRIQSASTPESIVINPAGAKITAIDLHSMNLLIIASKEPRLAPLIDKNPRLAEALFDSTLYKHKASETLTDFLARLVQQEFGSASSVAGTGFLSKFADDLTRLIGDKQGVAARADWQKALTVAALDYYYNKEASTATQFFKLESGGLHFNLDDIGVSTLKSLTLLRTAASSTAIGGDPFNVGNVSGARGWHVQSGEGSMNWAASKDADDVAIGGAQGDVLRAGSGSDYLVGGAGDDLLDGGVGYDTLLGGEGNDTYDFKTGETNDTITDSDGTGKIMVDGIQLTGGKKKADNYWISDDKVWGYQLMSGGDLIITRGSSTDRIVVQNWQSAGGNKLGITLADAPPAPPLTGNDLDPYGVFSVPGHATGDVMQSYWPTTTAHVEFAGLGGNDILLGARGDDIVEGGEGSDVIFGGLGSDKIQGGAGNDVIVSNVEATFMRRMWELAPVDPAPGATPYVSGAVVDYAYPDVVGDLLIKKDAEGTLYMPQFLDLDIELSADRTIATPRYTEDPSQADIVDAGVGDDFVWGGLGADTILGGADNDRLHGLGGADVMEGGDGNDEIFGKNGGSGECVTPAERQTSLRYPLLITGNPMTTTNHRQDGIRQPCGRTRRASVPARLRARGRGACTTRPVSRKHLGLHTNSAATANWLRRSGTATRHVCGVGWLGSERHQAKNAHSMRIAGLKELVRPMDRVFAASGSEALQ